MKESSMDSNPSDLQHQGQHLIQRCVIVQRDEKGYGLTVTGDNPVYVQSVKDDGAAKRAGVQIGDRIMKVNGTIVTHLNHIDVVELIKSGSFVALTLLGKPPAPPSGSSSPPPDQVASHPPQSPTRDHCKDEKTMSVKRTLDQERAFYEKTREEYTKKPSEKLQKLLAESTTRIKAFEAELAALCGSNRYEQALQSNNGPLSAPAGRTHNVGQIPRSLSESEWLSNKNNITNGSFEGDKTFPLIQPDHRAKSDLGSPLTIPNAWGEADKRASGSSPTPDIEPAEKRERSGSRLSNESSDNVFVNDNKIKQDTKPKTQMQILGQDDDEFLSDDEKFGEEHGPFNDLELLKNKPAHLAVFLHYLISNSDPSSLFFWLVTDSHREGNYKEMRKWSYEIYSSFLADKAPLKVDIDKGIVQAIEATLGKECSEETLRDLFVPASSACTSEINEQLADFRSKRALGLGSLFGDNQLEDENMDRNKEMEVVEHILLHHLENSLMELSSSPPNSAEYDRSSAMASALTTFMKQAGLPVKPGSNHANILEKCSSFTQKEGKSLFKIKTSKKIKGHHVVSTHYTNITFCNYCGGLLWGVADQGYQCTVCDYNVHKACFESIEETCPGPKSKRSKKGNGSGSTRRTALPNRSVSSAGDGRHVTNYQFIPAYNQPVKDKDGDVNDESREVEVTTDENLPPRKENRLYPKSEDGGDIESCSEGDDRPMSSPEEMIIPPASANTVKKSNHELFASRKFVIRSESVKTPKEIARKKPIVSGGIMNRSRKSVAGGDFFNRDNDLDALCVARGNDSPTLALDAVSEDEEEFDSDMEADSQPPWQNIVDKKILKKLKQKEIKRQEVIHELIHTEKTHVRNLKVLDKVFYRPMKKMNIWPYDMIKLLFPNLDELIQIHVSLLQAMKKRELESEVISRIGDIMLDRFEGEAGERARETCATFCNNQKYALDQLKQRKSKDPKLAQFITNCELNPLCRRLKLNEIISTSYQRLTKYPLLLEGISRNTPSSLEDSKEIERAITCTKDLLAWVNQSVKECENHQRLIEFQKKIDKRQIDNMSEKFDEFKQLDLTKKKLVYDGPLTWRISSKKLIDLHVLLLEDMLILLQKQDDKLILKCHSTNISNYQEKTEKQTHSPILKLNNLLTRNVATDKKAFFLVGTSTAGPQIYELVAATMTERKCWYKHVTDTIEAFRCRDRGRRGGVSVAGVTPRGPEPSLKRRGGIPPPGISMAPPPPTVQENGKSNEEEEDEEHKEDEEEDSTESVQESKTTSSTREMEDSVVVIPVDSLPHPEPETETETETETGEDQESENEPLPPPPPPLESVTDSEPLPPPPQIRASRPSPPPISVVPPLSSLYDKTFVADLTNEESVDEKSPTQTSVISAFSESGSSSSSSTETMKNTKSYGHCSIDDHDDSSLSNRSSLVLIAEQLRGKDEELKRTLEDKARIVAELRGAGMTSGYSSAGESHVNGDQMEARDLILAAILQANRLTVAVSDILSPGPGEEDITRSMSTMSLDRAIHDGDVSPQQQLVLSTSILNEQLTALLGIITERDMARESLRCDLQYANTQIQRLKQGRSSSRRTRDSGSSSMISSHDEYSNFRSVDSHRISSPTSSMADIDSDYAPLSEASASDWLSEDNMDVGRSASFSYRDRNSFILTNPDLAIGSECLDV